ncbi:MAG TPA: protein kinase [Blastocatellia bacterium]|nr:protein kinase [Blastocatellia bacterium]
MVSKGVSQIISHYRLLECAGEGGMGLVYKAEDLRLNRIAALKFLPPEFSDDERARRRLVEEAQAAASLNHPSIATVYELGQADGLSFIAMEYVEGESLARRIARGPMKIGEAIDIAMQVADALDAAHSRGIVHCDIKSSNVMVASNGNAKVLDFGLANLNSNLSRPQSAADSSGLVTGTASYMSPEQARGRGVDARTDLFSLGVLLYEMVAGRRPYEGAGLQATLKAILDDEAPPLASVREETPLELESIVRKALEKNRDARYQSARAIRSDLRELKQRLEPVGSVSESQGEQAISTLPETGFDQSPASRISAPGFKRWLLTASVAAASVVALDRIILQPQGGLWVRDALLLLIAAVCAIGYASARRGTGRAACAAPKGAAFRGLLPFQEADRDRFYGRETDTFALLDMIAHGEFRFGVLFGESGSGKTSLLKAAVLPKLWEAGFAPIYCRSYKDPMTALVEECRRLSQLEPVDAESPAHYLRRVAEELCAVLVIVCDQFEEFFVNFKTAREREPFLSFVAACFNDSRLPVRLLFAMRSDFLYLISSEFEGRIPEPLMSSRLYHLRNFDEAQAAVIIEKSARRAALPFEPELSRQVARDLAVADRVLPSELQIVGERLQSKRIYTLDEYRRAGGKEPLVHSFLEDVIASAGDKESARLLLRSLISDENTRLTLTVEEIAKRTQASQQTVRAILNLFASARLIREVQEDEPWRYELMHEYLIEKINQITGRVMDATQRANRLLKQYLSHYVVDKRTRIPISKLLFIRRYSDARRGRRERELLGKSLRIGLVKASALAVVLAAAAAVAAAALSVSEEWESVRLSDGHKAAVRQAVFSPDGRLLVSAGEDKEVIVWDFARRERLATFTDHEGIVTSVGFSPDGKWLATSSMDNTIIVRDAARLEKAFVLRVRTAGVGSLAFSPDGRFLVSIGSEAISWRVGNFEKVVETDLTVSGIPAFLPRTSKYISVKADGELTLADAATGRSEARKIAGLKQGWLAISPDGKKRISIGGDGIVQFVDMERDRVLGTFQAHKDNGRSVAFSPDGKLAASASENVILWDAQTQTKIATLEHESLVWNVAFSPDGRWLVSTHADGAILVWDVAERQRVANLNEHSAAVYGVAYSPDGDRIASSSEDTSVIIWDAATGQKEAVLIGHTSKANGVTFLPDGERVISSGFQDPLRLWDIGRGEVLRTFASTNPDMPGNNGFAVSPDGRWLATSNGVYDVSDGRVVCYLPDKFKNDDPDDDFLSQSSQIYGVAFSQDGRLLAYSTALSNSIGLLDTTSWEIIARAQEPGSSFISLRFSPDGELLATGDDEGKVELWNVNPLERIAIIGRHQARVKAVAFSPDGKQIASSSDDKTIALWNVGSRSLARRIGTHTAPVRSVAFSPDGKHIVSGEHDKSVRIHTRHRVLWGYRLD